MATPFHFRVSGEPRVFLQLLILLGTLLILAFATKNSLSPFVSLGDRKVSTFAVEAQGKGSAYPGARDFAVRITTILDGRSLTLDSVERAGNWQPGSVRAALHTSTKEDYRHGLLRFQGKEVVLVIEASSGSGVVRLLRDDGEVRAVNLSTSDGRQGPITVESPAAPSSPAVFVGSLVLFASCAWWFGPIRTGRNATPWLIFFLSVFHLLFWASQCVGITNDSPVYLSSFSRFVLGEPSYFPPGYPVFLGLADAISTESLGRWAALVQHSMVVGAAVWIYFLLRGVLRDEVALLGGILAGALSPVLTMAQAVMSEIPTLFAMVGAVYYAHRSAETGKLRATILAGLLAGWAGALRLVPVVGLLPAMCMIQLLAPRKHRFRLAGITMAVTAVVMILPVVWFGYKSGQSKFTNSTGFHLFNRVVNEQKQLDEAGPATRILLALLEGSDPRGVNVWRTYERVERRGLTDAQSESLFREVALEGIRKDVLGFLLFTPGLAWRILLDDTHRYWITGWGETPSVHPRLESPPPLMLTASALTWRWSLEQAHRRVWSIICWAAVGGIFLGLLLPQRFLIVALAWVPAGCLLSTGALEFLSPRYNVPIMPFVVALAVVPLGAIIDRFSSPEPDHRNIDSRKVAIHGPGST